MRKPVSMIAPAVATLCLLLAAGCEKENKTIKIATQSPLSGSMSVIGSDIKSGTQLAIEQLSGPLTAMGFKVELAPFDDQGNPDTGVANAKAIVSDPSVLGVVGHYNSGVQIPSSEEYHSANLCNVSPANTNPKVTDRGYVEVNRICGRDDVQGAVGAQFAKSKGIKSAYVLQDKTAYGQGIAEYFQKEATTQGIKVVGFAGTEEKANFDAILSPIIAAKPDCIYFGGMFDQAAVLFKQARQKGFKGMCLSDDGFDSPDAAKIGTDSLLKGGGTFYSTVSGPASVYPGTAKFITDFKAKFNNAPQPFAAQSYDCAALLLKGIEAAAKDSNGKLPARADVSKAVRALQDFPGITGAITFNAKGDLAKGKYFIIQVTSPDPAKWAENRIDTTLDIAPPQ
jgi:branched-chain amino acid transport system substrate-binding protein